MTDTPPPERFSTGLVAWRGVRWTITSGARKPATCWFSGKPIAVGDPVYRPLSNGAHRMQRVLASEWDGVI